MQITIEKVETIKFDCNAERQRILSAFENGKQQDTLIEIVNAFEKGFFQQCADLMKDFKPDDWENLHWTITDVITSFIRYHNRENPRTLYRFVPSKD